MQLKKKQLVLSASDLANHLGCQHLTQLSRKVAHNELTQPFRHDPLLETLIERGIQHERDFLEHLKLQGKSVFEVNRDEENGAERTLQAMREGYDVIVQAKLENDRWQGYADLLFKVDVPSKLGAWSYEVADTKLSQTTKAGTILQLSLYSEIIGSMQGETPERMTVVKPGEPFEVEHFRVDDFLAYYRLVKKHLEASVVTASESYPSPVPHCEICNWWVECNEVRRGDDHLCFIAGIRRDQINELQNQQLHTLEIFADSETPLKESPRSGSVAAYERVHRQAQIQQIGRTNESLEVEMLELEEKRGLLRLPEPDSGDVFFDIEGARHAPGGGLEYMLGFITCDQAESPVYGEYWALNRVQEKASFDKFIDFLMERWEQFPGMHIYHYAHYEPTAMKQLAMKHATREAEVDRLLRARRFIDLYAVVHQSLIASVESYSIKCLEPFYGYERLAVLEDARHSLQRFDRALETGRGEEVLDGDRRVVRDYNKDDCISTLELRNWLETLREEQIAKGQDIERPELLNGDASEAAEERNDEVSRVFDLLVSGLPEEERSPDEQARWLLAYLLDYFRREDKCLWWEFFRMHELQPDELLTERTGLAGLVFQEELPKGPRVRVPTHRYRFPPQEGHFGRGDNLVEVNGEAIGEVADFDLRTGIIDIKKRGDSADVHPSDIFVFKRVRPKPLPESLLLFGSLVAECSSSDSIQNARYAMLARQKPRLKTLQLPLAGDIADVAVKIAADLDNSVLPIQGPPGAGKTFIGSLMIAELAKRGKRVGVTAVSHKVITNILSAVVSRSGDAVTCAQKTGAGSDDHPPSIEVLKNNEAAVSALNGGRVVGGTAWLWANEQMEQKLDYLFIDEAGQMSLAIALAAGRAAKNIILLGDPQQLEQPQKGDHPEGAEVAALNHLLDGRPTIADDRGLFLPQTWRLNPAICRFTSEQFYEGRLSSQDGRECQVIRGGSVFPESGLAFYPVPHEGNQNQSLEEVDAVRSVFDILLDGSHSWVDADDIEAELTLDDILVVAPYNAQVAQLQNELPARARIGTVDKFQGQEAAVVIYSTTSSSAEDAPRGMTFLFSPNRLNVATSRAKCLAILVGSPELFQPDCTTPDQMRLANAFCRFLELATTVSPRS